MVSKKKSEEGLRRNDMGNDAEDYEYYKKVIMNPLHKVERHEHRNDPYDFSMEERGFVTETKKFMKRF